MGGRARPPYMSRPYGIGGEGTGGTPQISVAQGNCVRLKVGMSVSITLGRCRLTGYVWSSTDR